MTSTSSLVSSLRAYLLSSLKSLPGSRTFHLHILVSSPRKPAQSLFPYASPRPKCMLQDIVILLSEQVGHTCDKEDGRSDTSITIDITPRTFVSAIEASVYAFPTSNSTILYISKVDGTGQGTFPSPTSTLVSAVLAFYASPRSPLHTTHVTHHLWIHLFARSQRQYLFPNSADHPNKKPLGDVALCKWWKRILSDLAKTVQEPQGENNVNDSTGAASAIVAPCIRLYHLLPGQSELEASYLLRESDASFPSSVVKWIYSHPYDIFAELGLPYLSGPNSKVSSHGLERPPLASLIPHFEDDPKSRFLDELSATSEEQAIAVPVPTPKRKRPRTDDTAETGNSTLTHDNSDDILHPEKLTSTANETGFQEKIDEQGAPLTQGTPSGAVPQPPTIMYIPPSSSPPPVECRSPSLRLSTPEPMARPHTSLLSPHTPTLPNFPNSLLSPHTPSPDPSRSAAASRTPTISTSPRTPQSPRTPRRPISDLDTVSPAEFWERMSYRQECAQGAVTGFFVAIFSQRFNPTAGNDCIPDSSHMRTDVYKPYVSEHGATLDKHPTLLEEGTVPHSLVKRVMTSLLTGVEFSTTERAHKGTRVIETAIEGLCEGLGHVSIKEGHAPESLIKDTGSPNVYKAHVYGIVPVSNPPLVRTSVNAASEVTSVINVLGVRRKKKRE